MGYAPRLFSQRSPQERTIRNRPSCRPEPVLLFDWEADIGLDCHPNSL